MRGNRLVIAVDYGTTHTGVAMCRTSDMAFNKEHIQVIHDWPAAHTMIGTKEKVPSEISFSSGDVLWGSMIPSQTPRLMWTKLDLDTPRGGEAATVRKENVYGRLNPVDVTASFLSKVRQHLVKALDNQYGPTVWGMLPITLVITLPTIWSDDAKNRTLKAFNEAGFSILGFPQLKRTVTITEPEAAALYTLKTQASTCDEELRVNDSFVVCDMGGVTVDLISYRVSSTEPLALEEITTGTSDQCGGSFVERAFISWLETRLGASDFEGIAGCSAKECLRTSFPRNLARMVREFTVTAKSDFSGSEQYYLRLPTPLSEIEDEDRGISEGKLCLKAEDMESIFQPCLRQTQHLLQNQMVGAIMNSESKYVVFVGGFAESPYMFGQLKARCELYEMQAIRPQHAWSAIVRGAIAKGLEGDGRAIMHPKCRRHYGVSVAVPFTIGVHSDWDLHFCPFSGQKLAINQMKWAPRKGDELNASQRWHAEYAVHVKFWTCEDRAIELRLVACDQDCPPKLRSHKSIYQVATMSFNTREIPRNFLKLLKSPSGKPYYQAALTIHVAIQSSLRYQVEIGDRTLASTTIDYETEVRENCSGERGS